MRNPKSITGLKRTHHEAIGRVASEWAQLITIVDEAIWEMLGIGTMESDGRIVTQHLNDAGKLAMIEAFAFYKITPRNTFLKFRKMIEEIDKIRVKRNEIVHGEWTDDPRRRSGIVHRYNWYARRFVNVKHGPMSARDIHAVADNIIEQGEALWVFLYEQNVWTFPSPTKSA